MLHAKFQDHMTSGSGDMGMVAILGHVTWTIYINLHSQAKKFCLDMPSGFRGDV